MKKVVRLLSLLPGLFYAIGVLAQAPVAEPKLSVEDRMAKARAAKAEKKDVRTAAKSDLNATGPGDKGRATMYRSGRTPSTNYGAPAEKKLKGPNGEVVHTGERGAKYYINKNGQRTYLSSNQ